MKKTITLILLTISIMAFAQKNKDIERINNKIENINQKIDGIDKRVTLKDVINQEKQKLYKEKFEQVNTTIKEAKKREDSFLSYIQWFFSIIGTVILFFLGGSFFEMKKAKEKITTDFETELIAFKQETAEEVKNITAKLVENFKKELAITTKKNVEELTYMVEEKTWEFRLMAKAHIMIVNPEADDDKKNATKVLKFFKEKGAEISNFSIPFEQSNEIIQQVNQSFINDRFNILLLKNSYGNWNLKNKTNELNAAKIAKGINKKAMLVYFGPGNVGFFPSRPENYYPLYNGNYSNLKIQEKTLSDKKDKISEEEKMKLEEIRKEIKKMVTDVRNKHISEINNIIDTISFANTPSKLYPNLIDALKYMDIINPKINA